MSGPDDEERRCTCGAIFSAPHRPPDGHALRWTHLRSCACMPRRLTAEELHALLLPIFERVHATDLGHYGANDCAAHCAIALSPEGWSPGDDLSEALRYYFNRGRRPLNAEARWHVEREQAVALAEAALAAAGWRS